MRFLYTILAVVLVWVPVAGRASDEAGCAGPRPAAGYVARGVAGSGLPRVDNLAVGPGGALYATLELGRGRGRVVRVRPGRAPETLMAGLNRPDGLVISGSLLYVVEESKKGRLMEYDLESGSARTLARLRHPEGLAVLASGSLVVSEDRRKGRLVEVGLDGTVRVLLDGLLRPEGIVVDARGGIFIAETATGRVLEYRDGRTRVVVGGLNEPDQLAIRAGGGLLITEDASPGRLLSYRRGRLETIAGCLDEPQGVVPVAGGILVSEQGRGRILLIAPR